VALLEATGYTRIFINGLPHEGDPYDFGQTVISFRLKEGTNEFVCTFGEQGKVASKVVIPAKEVQFSPSDMTLPSLIRGERPEKWGAVRMLNASENHLTDLTLRCVLETIEVISFPVDMVMPMTIRKLKFKIPQPQNAIRGDKITATISLINNQGIEIDQRGCLRTPFRLLNLFKPP